MLRFSHSFSGQVSPRRQNYRALVMWAVMFFMFSQLMFSCINQSLSARASSPQLVQNALTRTWSRTDLPVKNGVSRTWIWGPQPNHAGIFEPYQQAPGGQREISYFDKSRMEINDPATDSTSKWFVTNGLLVKEMISGMIQIGDAQFMPYHPAQEAVAGDPVQYNTAAPTYESFKNLASLDLDHRSTNRAGQSVTERLAKDGSVQADGSLADTYHVTYSFYEPTLGHNVPDVFKRFFDLKGIVTEDSGRTFTDGTVFDWIYAAGLPLSEPYWAKVKVAGVEKDVLMQAFERRVLTYTPSNDAGWQVEMGNVGQHYYKWRYPVGEDLAATDPNGGGNGGRGGNPGGGNNPGGGSNPGGGGTPGGGGNCTSVANPDDITLNANTAGAVNLLIGGKVTLPLSIAALNCFVGPVDLEVSGATSGVSTDLSASHVTVGPGATGNVNLNVDAAPGATPGGLNLTVTARAKNKLGQPIAHSINLGINLSTAGNCTPTANPDDITLNANTSGVVNLLVGGKVSLPLSITSVNCFVGPVDLEVSGATGGISADLSASHVTVGPGVSANINLNVGASLGTLPTGLNLTVTVRAKNKLSQPIAHSVSLGIKLSVGGSGSPTVPPVTTPSAPLPTVPPVTTPSVPVPTVTVPPVTTPSVPVPTVTVPAVPTVTVPPVPTVTVPPIPTVTVPPLPTVKL